MSARDTRNKLVTLLEKDSQLVENITLDGSGEQYYMLRPSYTGFISYQISDPDSNLSDACAINLEMSNDGVNWLQATDANSEDITHSLAVGSTVLEKLSDVNPAIKLRLYFTSSVTGEITISTRI